MSAWTRRSSNGKAEEKIVPPRLRIPYWKGLGADSEEKHEPVGDTNTANMDSLKVLDPYVWTGCISQERLCVDSGSR